ncbi:MAG: hypothetical protein GX981_07190 [Tissierellia bacterium]|nr:hypothetical protein [Tissierellia bacterium]
MFKRLILTLVNGIALFLLLILHIITPKVSKKTILFGVKVPKDAIYYPEVQKLYKEYERISQKIGVIVLIILSLLVFYFDHLGFQVLSIFFYIGVLFIIYLRTNYKARKLKKENNWDKIGSKVVILDKEDSLEIQTKTEDDLWILGNTIYCNSKDSSLFVKKRYGTGWVINLGRPLGKILFTIFLIGLIIIIFKFIKI